jgi:hypothetical protein
MGIETGFTLRAIQAAAAAADFDADGDVDGADLALWSAGFGTIGTATHMQGDADADLDADGADFLVWQQDLGNGATLATAAAVPEPATGILFVLGGAAARIFHRPVALFRKPLRARQT